MKRVLLFVALLIPLFFASYELFILQNAKDPIKYIYTFTGVSATIILFATITISLIKKWINLIKYRRMIGLFGFFYAFLHFLNFFILDAELDFGFVVSETLDKPFIYLGMIALFILLFMAITSTKQLFKRYNKYHQLIYIALGLITIHFVMAQKSLNIPQWGYLAIIAVIAFAKVFQLLSKYKIIKS